MIALVLLLVVVVTYGVRGCDRDTGLAPSTDEYVPPDSGGSPTSFSGTSNSGAVSESNFMDIPVMMTEKLGHDQFDGVITTRLSPAGDQYLVSGAFVRGGRKYLGFEVFDLQSQSLWDHVFSSSGYQSANAWYFAGGRYIAALAVDSEQAGELHILDSAGKSVLSRDVDGWTVPVLSDDGSWLALFNEKRRVVQICGGASYTPIWSLSFAKGSTGIFLGNGPDFLSIEEGRLRLFNEKGQITWTISLPEGGHLNAAFSPDGRYLAVTTEDPDSTVYLYSVGDGSLLWSQFLVPGGHKHLAFSQDSSSVVVYDVGQHAAIYLLDVGSGEIPWRFYLEGRADSAITMEDLDFSPSGDYIVADLIESTAASDSYSFYHYLLRLSAEDGRPLWVSPVGSGVDVDLQVRQGLALVGTNHTLDAYGNISNTVTVVSYQADDPGASSDDSGQGASDDSATGDSGGAGAGDSGGSGDSTGSGGD